MECSDQLSVDHWLGRKLGRYEVSGVLGAGKKGFVLRAYDPAMEREVAIRVLTEQLSADELERRRFLFGAKSAGKFQHVNTVTVHEVAQQDDISYLVMEMVSGGSAGDQLEQNGAFEVTEATRMVIEASWGLSAAHQEGFVHRDIRAGKTVRTLRPRAVSGFFLFLG